MKQVAVLGVGMTRFGKHKDMSIKDLVREAVQGALDDAGVEKRHLQAAYVGNAAAGAMTGQHMIRGQVTLAPMGIQDIPVYNVENACASSSSAFNLAWQAVASGVHDCALAVGFEKLYDSDKKKSFLALESGMDVADHMVYIKAVEQALGAGEKIFKEGGPNRSRFMDIYSFFSRPFTERYGLTQKHFAMLSVKAHKNGALNPKAQYLEVNERTPMNSKANKERQYFNPEVESLLNTPQMRAMQESKLQATLRYFYDKVPFDRERMDKAGIKPEGIGSFDELPRRLPLCSQDDFRAIFDRVDNDMFAANDLQFGEERMQDMHLLTTTSGTTGIPTPYPVFHKTTLAMNEIGREDCAQAFLSG